MIVYLLTAVGFEESRVIAVEVFESDAVDRLQRYDPNRPWWVEGYDLAVWEVQGRLIEKRRLMDCVHRKTRDALEPAVEDLPDDA